MPQIDDLDARLPRGFEDVIPDSQRLGRLIEGFVTPGHDDMDRLCREDGTRCQSHSGSFSLGSQDQVCLGLRRHEVVNLGRLRRRRGGRGRRSRAERCGEDALPPRSCQAPIVALTASTRESPTARM